MSRKMKCCKLLSSNKLSLCSRSCFDSAVDTKTTEVTGIKTSAVLSMFTTCYAGYHWREDSNNVLQHKLRSCLCLLASFVCNHCTVLLTNIPYNTIFLLLIKYCTNVHLVTKHIVAQCVQVSLWYLSQIWAKPTRFSNLDLECFTNACSSYPLLVCCCDCRLLIRQSVPASFPHTVLGSWA